VMRFNRDIEVVSTLLVRTHLGNSHESRYGIYYREYNSLDLFAVHSSGSWVLNENKRGLIDILSP
jgi:hypothetical protein